MPEDSNYRTQVRFEAGNEVELIFAMPGPDTYPVTIEQDNGGECVTIREGKDMYGRGPRVVVREVPRSRIMWRRGGTVSLRLGSKQRTDG